MVGFIGTETEYGIATPTDPYASPIATSTHAIVAYSLKHQHARTRWDFASESPLRDTRGFDLRRYHSAPVIDPHALGVANLVLTNGARFYVDHAHPEYSAPETTNAFDAMLYDAAGDRIMHDAVREVAAHSERNHSVLEGHPPCPPLKIYKNNVDGKGASYGTHENYCYDRTAVEFDDLAQALIPFFVCRQVVIGAGRVGLGERSQEAGFQISQRADYIETTVSLETTLNRGIINTRDEPHGDADAIGRLHVIIGDANMSQVSNVLKLGMTKLVLSAIEQGARFDDVALADPVAAVKVVSRDLDCRASLELADGRRLTALEILAAYRQRVEETLGETLDVHDRRVLDLWDEVCAKLAVDPLSTSDMLDWTAKLALIRRYVDRGLAMDDPKVALIDLQYSDIDESKGLYYALVRKGLMRTLVTADDIARAMAEPPADTRAWIRGTVLRCFGDAVVAANWDNVVVDVSRLKGSSSGDDAAGVDTVEKTVSLTSLCCGTRAEVMGETPTDDSTALSERAADWIRQRAV